MLSATEIATMRAALDASLPDSATVKRRTLTSDGAGGFTESWATQATVACRLAPSGLSPAERVISDKVTATSTWTITMPALTDVGVADRIVIGGSRTFEVVGVLTSSEEICRQVVATEIV